ncbi:MAG: B12-binding domain-containing radical SAM protein [Promethearchaeota archaeon]
MERNIIIKDWSKIDITFGLIYPNIYEIGMSSYAIRLLYHLLNSNNNIACERLFLPKSINYPASKDQTNKDDLRSIENKVLPEEFDILGFSVQYENDFKNILWILEKAEIPLLRDERKFINMNEKKNYPIIIAGGSVITSNPLPLNLYFDLLFIGDSELSLSAFLSIFRRYKNNEISYSQLLDTIAHVEGIYVPSLNNNPKRVVLQDLDKSQILANQILSVNSNQKKIFQQNFLLEINRGCPYKCKFCISSYHNSPFRNRSYKNIVETIESGIFKTKFDTISLIGSCVSAHPKFIEICEYIINKGINLTIPSIRIEHINKKIIKILEKANIKTITIAPEAGSEKLRYEMGKLISNESIFSAIKQIKGSTIKNIKLYFLIGLPNEKDEDIRELILFIKAINNIGFNKNSLRININPFIPKFNTPFAKSIDFLLDQNFGSFKKKYQKMEQELTNLPSIKLKFKNYKSIIKNAKLQALLSLGDQEISTFLKSYYSNGAHFGALRRAQNELKFDINEYFMKIKSGYHPWNF